MDHQQPLEERRRRRESDREEEGALVDAPRVQTVCSQVFGAVSPSSFCTMIQSPMNTSSPSNPLPVSPLQRPAYIVQPSLEARAVLNSKKKAW